MIPTKVVWDMIPLEMWSGNKPLVEHLRMFGCIAWAHIPDDKRKKLDGKSNACIMTGYSDESKAYRLFDPIKQEIICKRDISLDEQTLGVALLNFSFGLLSNNPLEILKNSGLIDYFTTSTCVSTSLSIV
jgi:hypothetical protein